ncbi:MAG: epr, partial [Frankiales bacterium]|nr:epr [Frankiales bacterium]
MLVATLVLPVLPAAAAGTPPQKTWHADEATVPDARSAGRNGQGVVVAVLDSWVDRAHKDFEGRVLAGADCLRGACVAGPAPADQCDHGTHVAGTVAASSFGVAPKATILPVRVLSYDPANGECVGRPDDVTAGIRWAVRNGARVLNLSLGPDVPGLSASSSIPAAVQEAADAGVVVVFSAGNASVPVTDSYGGAAVIVAATAPGGKLASYSQRGSGVDLAAPGGDPKTPDVCSQADCVTSLFPGNRYSVAAGTSMAAPHVAGIAALLLGQDPRRSREAVLDRLL